MFVLVIRLNSSVRFFSSKNNKKKDKIILPNGKSARFKKPKDLLPPVATDLSSLYGRLPDDVLVDQVLQLRSPFFRTFPINEGTILDLAADKAVSKLPQNLHERAMSMARNLADAKDARAMANALEKNLIWDSSRVITSGSSAKEKKLLEVSVNKKKWAKKKINKSSPRFVYQVQRYNVVDRANIRKARRELRKLKKLLTRTRGVVNRRLLQFKILNARLSKRKAAFRILFRKMEHIRRKKSAYYKALIVEALPAIKKLERRVFIWRRVHKFKVVYPRDAGHFFYLKMRESLFNLLKIHPARAHLKKYLSKALKSYSRFGKKIMIGRKLLKISAPAWQKTYPSRRLYFRAKRAANALIIADIIGASKSQQLSAYSNGYNFSGQFVNKFFSRRIYKSRLFRARPTPMNKLYRRIWKRLHFPVSPLKRMLRGALFKIILRAEKDYLKNRVPLKYDLPYIKNRNSSQEVDAAIRNFDGLFPWSVNFRRTSKVRASEFLWDHRIFQKRDTLFSFYVDNNSSFLGFSHSVNKVTARAANLRIFGKLLNTQFSQFLKFIDSDTYVTKSAQNSAHPSLLLYNRRDSATSLRLSNSLSGFFPYFSDAITQEFSYPARELIIFGGALGWDRQTGILSQDAIEEDRKRVSYDKVRNNAFYSTAFNRFWNINFHKHNSYGLTRNNYKMFGTGVMGSNFLLNYESALKSNFNNFYSCNKAATIKMVNSLISASIVSESAPKQAQLIRSAIKSLNRSSAVLKRLKRRVKWVNPNHSENKIFKHGSFFVKTHSMKQPYFASAYNKVYSLVFKSYNRHFRKYPSIFGTDDFSWMLKQAFKQNAIESEYIALPLLIYFSKIVTRLALLRIYKNTPLFKQLHSPYLIALNNSVRDSRLMDELIPDERDAIDSSSSDLLTRNFERYLILRKRLELERGPYRVNIFESKYDRALYRFWKNFKANMDRRVFLATVGPYEDFRQRTERGVTRVFWSPKIWKRRVVSYLRILKRINLKRLIKARSVPRYAFPIRGRTWREKKFSSSLVFPPFVRSRKANLKRPSRGVVKMFQQAMKLRYGWRRFQETGSRDEVLEAEATSQAELEFIGRELRLEAGLASCKFSKPSHLILKVFKDLRLNSKDSPAKALMSKNFKSFFFKPRPVQKLFDLTYAHMRLKRSKSDYSFERSDNLFNFFESSSLPKTAPELENLLSSARREVLKNVLRPKNAAKNNINLFKRPDSKAFGYHFLRFSLADHIARSLGEVRRHFVYECRWSKYITDVFLNLVRFNKNTILRKRNVEAKGRSIFVYYTQKKTWYQRKFNRPFSMMASKSTAAPYSYDMKLHALTSVYGFRKFAAVRRRIRAKHYRQKVFIKKILRRQFACNMSSLHTRWRLAKETKRKWFKYFDEFEGRLTNILCLMNYFDNLDSSTSSILSGVIRVNNSICVNPDYRVKPFDVISIDLQVYLDLRASKLMKLINRHLARGDVSKDAKRRILDYAAEFLKKYSAVARLRGEGYSVTKFLFFQKLLSAVVTKIENRKKQFKGPARKPRGNLSRKKQGFTPQRTARINYYTKADLGGGADYTKFHVRPSMPPEDRLYTPSRIRRMLIRALRGDASGLSSSFTTSNNIFYKFNNIAIFLRRPHTINEMFENSSIRATDTYNAEVIQEFYTSRFWK